MKTKYRYLSEQRANKEKSSQKAVKPPEYQEVLRVR